MDNRKKEQKKKEKDSKEEYEKPSLTKYSKMHRITAVSGQELTS